MMVQSLYGGQTLRLAGDSTGRDESPDLSAARAELEKTARAIARLLLRSQYDEMELAELDVRARGLRAFIRANRPRWLECDGNEIAPPDGAAAVGMCSPELVRRSLDDRRHE